MPAYVHDIVKVQVYCAWAEVMLGETSFTSPVARPNPRGHAIKKLDACPLVFSSDAITVSEEIFENGNKCQQGVWHLMVHMAGPDTAENWIADDLPRTIGAFAWTIQPASAADALRSRSDASPERYLQNRDSPSWRQRTGGRCRAGSVSPGMEIVSAVRAGNELPRVAVQDSLPLRQSPPPEMVPFPIVKETEEFLEANLTAPEPIPEHLTDQDILAALDSIPADFRAVILMVDVEEFAYKEAAEILSVPIGTVMSRLNRGRKLLKEQLADAARSFGIGEPI